jgi:hypothetical protein
VGVSSRNLLITGDNIEGATEFIVCELHLWRGLLTAASIDRHEKGTEKRNEKGSSGLLEEMDLLPNCIEQYSIYPIAFFLSDSYVLAIPKTILLSTGAQQKPEVDENGTSEREKTGQRNRR